MNSEYRLVEKVGDFPLDENLVDDFIHYVNGLDLPKTHVLSDDDDDEQNPYFNKYIIYDDIFKRFFQNPGDYELFVKTAIHTNVLPPCQDKKDEHLTRSLVGAVHLFLTEYYKKFFIMRMSITFTDPGSFMHYHRDLAGENADRFVIDVTDSENGMSGIEVEDRLYPLERLAVYKLDTTRMHRAANYSPRHKKVSLIIQGISEFEQYLEYQRKHMDVFYQTMSLSPFSEGTQMYT
ncbi:MAG: hypothetical protein V1244_03890 [Nitrospinaceae bacterium]|nr:hypothetical protein [Nitrospinaceae bacterium]